MSPENNKTEEHRRADYASKKGEVVLRPHEYDGIQEFDQKLPNWWLITFFGAILFYLLYWVIYYQTDWFQTDAESVTEAMTEVFDVQEEMLQQTLADLSDEILVHEWAGKPNIVSRGEAHYQKVCIGCHGPNLDAPSKAALSLVDGEWKYGGRPMEIFKMINEGTPPDSKGMESGAKMLPRGGGNFTLQEIAEMVAFLISKNPNDFKEY